MNEVLDKGTKQVSTIDYEAEARKDGWKPEAEYKGPEGGFVSAEEFYKRGELTKPILKQQRDEARKQAEQGKAVTDALKAEIEEIKKTSQEAIKFMQDGLERKYKADVAALQTEKAAAIAAGDGAKVIEIEQNLETLKEEKVEKKAEVKKEAVLEQPKIHPGWPKWAAENAWYNENEEAQQVAITRGFQMAKKDPKLEGPALWDKVKEDLIQRYPEWFPEEAEKNRPSGQRGGQANASNGSAKTYANLPAEAKAACEKFLKSGMIKSREQYVENYDWSE